MVGVIKNRLLSCSLLFFQCFYIFSGIILFGIPYTNATGVSGLNIAPVISSNNTYTIAQGVLPVTTLTATDDSTNVIMEYGKNTVSSNTWKTITHSEMCNPVVVVGHRGLVNTETQRETRLKSKTPTSFQVKADNYTGTPPASTSIDYIVVSAGSKSLSTGTNTLKYQAGSPSVSTVFCNATKPDTTTSSVSFSPTFTSPPAVLHTVSSNNDITWTSSMVNGDSGSRASEPSTTKMGVFLQRSFESCTHAAETIDYIAFQPGFYNFSSQGIQVNSVVSTDTIASVTTAGNNITFPTAFPSGAPSTFIVDQLGEDGGNGGYGSIHSGGTPTSTTIPATVDEDGPGADRNHTTEPFAAVAFNTANGKITEPNILSYSISGGVDASFFDFNTTTKALSFKSGKNQGIAEDANGDGVYEVQVQVCDSHCNSKCTTKNLTITTNVIPNNIILSNNAINENIPANTTLGTLSTTDINTSDTHSYSLVSGIGDNDNGSFTITGNTLKINTSPDYEIKNTYSVRIQTNDGKGGTFQKTFTISINDLDEIPPIITRTGSGTINVVKNSTYTELGSTCSDNFDTTCTVIVGGATVDTSTLGTYTITYNVSDASGNAATQVTRTVNVVTGNAPVITTLGSSPVTIEVLSAYNDTGATANDTEDGDISGDITTVNPVNTSATGSYTVTYDVIDSSDNSAIQKTRTVNVTDTIKPIITRSGAAVVNLTQGDSYTDAGATCSDNFDASCNVLVGGDVVDTTRVGTYTITYNASDISGNTATQVSRTVNVVAAGILINEVEYDTPGVESASEWFEIYNPTSGIISLENWTITEKVGTSSTKSYTFTGGVTIPAGGYIVVTNDTTAFNAIHSGITPDIDLPGVSYFSLKNTPDDYLELKDSQGNSIDFVAWENIGLGWNIEAIDKSICRLSTPDTDTVSDWTSNCIATPKAVNQFNTVPTNISLTTNTINENNASGATVAVLSSTDPDIGDTHIYTLVAGSGDTDNASFSISGSNLTIDTVTDYETKTHYSIRIRTDDQNGGLYEEEVIISVNNINLTPTDISISSQNIDENNTIGTLIGTLSGVDDGEDTSTLNYSLACSTAGTDDGSFSISGTNLRAAAIYDYEIKSSYDICVRVSDGVQSYDENFTISIHDVDEVNPVVVITPITKLKNIAITDTTIQITDNVGVNAVDISIDAASSATASSLSCTQTTTTQVDCTVSVDSSGDIVIKALDTSGNIGKDTETNYIIDTVAPNIPSVVIDTESPQSVNNPVVSFSSLDNVGVDHYEITYYADDGGAGTGTVTTINPATSPVSLFLDPDELVHTITVTVYDTAGNSSTTITKFPPIITISAPTKISGVTITDSTVTIKAPTGNDLTNIALAPGTTGASLVACIGNGGDTTDPYATPVTCTINSISDSGTITIVAEDNGNGALGSNSQSYIIDTVDPVVTITPGIKLDNVAITDTTIAITDDIGIDVSGVMIDGSSTVLSSNFSCTQSGSLRVDCTISIDDSGDLIITAEDLAGNAASDTETNYIIDMTPPVLSLIGTTPETVEYLSFYSDSGSEFSDNIDGTGSVIGAGSVNTGILGDYTLTYDYTDTAGNPATQITRLVQVVDTTKPGITLIGTTPVTLEVGSSYSDGGATATDNYDGNISGSITSSGSVNTSLLGDYTIEYDVTDSNGNIADTVTRIVSVVDTTKPTVTLTGDDEIVIEVGGSYTELGATATDNYDTISSGSITIDNSSVTTSIVGSYLVTYNVSDTSGNPAVEVTRTVIIQDTTIPVITLIGTTPVILEVGSSYSDDGATASDNYDGNITSSIVTSNPVNMAVVDSYIVTYNVTDSSGNTATQVNRVVNVVDTTKPGITLIGTTPVTLEVGSSYSDGGATATDNYDGNISGSITSSGSVNTSLLGDYTIEYDVTDSNGNIADTVTRIVSIVDTTSPSISLVGSSPLTLYKNAIYTEFGATCSDNYDLSCSAIVGGDTVDTSTIGSYTITYNATDTNSNAAGQVTRIVNVVTGNTPTITLNGTTPITVEVNTSYIDAGAIANDTEDGNISANLVINNGVDINTVGSYTITYNVIDSSDNIATQVSRIVHVVDTTPPTINLTGSGTIDILRNNTYTEYGANCSDNYDVSCSVTIGGDTVDTTILGAYTVAYNTTDTNSNSAVQVTRTVNVIPGNTPTLSLNGSGSISVEVSTNYVDAGAIATDIEDGNISPAIIAVNPVDTITLGFYTITYDVTDANGNTATQVTRTVNIVDTTPPIITLTGSGIVNIFRNKTYTELGANCSDNYDVSCSVTIGGDTVDTTTLGTYTVAYNVTDTNSNIAIQITRTVNVVAGNTPTLTLLGATPVFVQVGNTYNDAGATAVDTDDGDITSSIVAINSVNTATAGSYTVTYNVVDSSSNAATQVTRIVNVVSSMNDTDGDGVPDVVEVEQGTNPTDINDYLDTDGDNISNYSDGDDDGDGSIDSIESAAPNNGDFNGDGIQDVLQKKVATIRSSVIGQYTSLDTTSGLGSCGSTEFSMLRESTLPVQDMFEDYPLGLAKFRLECTTPGDTADIKIYLEKVYDTSSWEYRKYNETTQTYTDISSIVTYTIENVGGTDLTVMNYSITDGGIYDEDGITNGIIIDPSGPAIENRGSSGEVVYDRCEGDDTSGSIYDGSCGDNTQDEITPEKEENIPVTESSTTIEDEEETVSQNPEYSLENNFDSCPIVGHIKNPNYLYQPSGVFVDETDSLYKDEILKFKAIGIVDGYADGSFAPKNDITRAEFLKVALISHCYSYKNLEGTTEYTDVLPATWQARVIEKAQSLGMINGDTDTAGNKVFRPNDVITKAEAVKILMRISMIQAQEPEELGYSDIEVDWHIPYVRTGQTLGIFNPENDNSLFYPGGGVKREDMVYLIQELVELYK